MESVSWARLGDSSEELTSRAAAVLRSSPLLMRVMRTLREIDLPDWLVFSGAVYQPILNHLTGRDVEFGIKDYEVGYFDASDVTYDAEDAVIQRVAKYFEPPLRDLVEVRNQARVHLWFEGHFGEPYIPLSCTAEALTRFTSPLFAIGAFLKSNDELTVVAPYGLEDLFNLRLHPTAHVSKTGFERTARSLVQCWPEVTIAGECDALRMSRGD